MWRRSRRAAGRHLRRRTSAPRAPRRPSRFHEPRSASRAAMSDPDVIVVGAGAAGLTVARDVTAGGLRVLVLEARDRVGGRILTHHTEDGPVELGAEYVHGEMDEILGVAKRASLPLRE